MTENRNSGVVTSHDLLKEMGRRIRLLRLSRNVTQQMLASEAGIGTRTLCRLEAGEGPTLDSFLRVALALGLAERVLNSLPVDEIRPMERVVSRDRERKRARPRSGQEVLQRWSWGDGWNE